MIFNVYFINCIAYLNGHEYTFCDSTGGVVSTYAERHGLELNGEMLDFDGKISSIRYMSNFDSFNYKLD